jgi:hypothetical protein
MTAARRSELAAYAVAVVASAVLVTRAWRIDFDYSIDFQTYWLAGARVLHGQAAELYEPGGGPGAGTPIAMGPSEFKNIPLVAAGFVPWAVFDYATAKRIFWWAGLAAIAAAAACVGLWVLPASTGPPGARIALALAAIAAMAPAHIALRHGQTTPFIAALIAIWLAAAVRGREVLAGSALGLACLVKFPPFALLALDLARGRWRAAAACAGTVLGGLLLSVALFGWELHREYGRGVGEQAGRVMTGHNNQSLAATATRLSGPSPHQDWTARPMERGARFAAGAAALGLTCLVAWSVMRTAPAVPREAAPVVALGILVLPVAWDHYVLMLAPALPVWIATLGRRVLLAAAVAAYILLALPTPGGWIDAAAPSGPAGALVVSHYAAGLIAVILIASASALRNRA